MKKPLKIIILVAIILLSGFYVYVNRDIFKKESKLNNLFQKDIVEIKNGSLDGVFNLISEEYVFFNSGAVTIASSTADSIHFKIYTFHLGHPGYYSGIAKRVASSSIVYYSNTKEEDDEMGMMGLCFVTIIFDDLDHLTYQIENPKNLESDDSGCFGHVGAHGTFFDNQIHERDWEIESPTIEKLGFEKKDIEQFNLLIDGLIEEVGLVADSQNSTKKLSSSEIENSLVYSIDRPNMYDGMPCDYTNPMGYCTFAVFLKDDSGHYWILGGNTYDLQGDNPKGFVYSTNHELWKNKLPDVFEEEINRLGLDINSVLFK